MNLFKWYFYSIIYLIKIRLTTSKKKWILSRTACLVNDSYKILNIKSDVVYNIQKGRVDFLNSYLNNTINRPKLILINFIERRDIKVLFLQQKYFHLPQYNKPSLFILDSYSELVDKQFEREDMLSGKFNSCFSDLAKKKSYGLKCNDLIPLNNLFETYLTFFKSFRTYSDCPILFVFFPSSLEKRNVYLERSKEIKMVIKKIETLFDNFHTIEIPEELVKHSKLDKNPYHFDEEVYRFLANEIKYKNILPF